MWLLRGGVCGGKRGGGGGQRQLMKSQSTTRVGRTLFSNSRGADSPEKTLRSNVPDRRRFPKEKASEVFEEPNIGPGVVVLKMSALEGKRSMLLVTLEKSSARRPRGKGKCP